MAQFASAQPDSSAAKAGRSWLTWVGRASALLLLAAACVGAYWLGSRQPTAIEERLYVDPKYLDFGEVWENPKFEWVLPIENRSNEDVEIAGFSSTCTCLAIEPRRLTIRPGRTAHVRLTVDLTYRPAKASRRPRKPDEGSGFRTFESADPVRQFQLPVYLHDHEGHAFAAWELKTRVRCAISVDSRSLSLGHNLVRSRGFPSLYVDVACWHPVEHLRTQCDPPIADSTVHHSTPDKKHFVVKITPHHTLKPGPLDFQVTLYPVNRDQSELPGIPLRVLGYVLHEIQAVPAALLAGAREVGEEVEEMITLRSLRDESFEVDHWQTRSPDLSVERVRTGREKHSEFRVTQRVSQLGYREATLVFTIRRADGNTDTVPVTASYCGIPSKR